MKIPFSPSVASSIMLALTTLFSMRISAQQVVPSISSRIDGIFHYLEEQEGGLSLVGKPARTAGTLRFQQPLSEDEIRSYEDLGIEFRKIDGRLMHSSTIYPALIPFSSLPILQQDDRLIFVQSSWKPASVPPLWVSRTQIEAEEVWKLTDGLTRSVTGKGILVADFDTGVDFLHPMMWRADGDTLEWMDVNRDGVFSPGADAIDINRNGKADSAETLSYLEFRFAAAGNDTGRYDSDLDWLYNDRNNNRARDWGKTSGFSESTPTYGEQWYASLDANRNNRLDPGEKLVALKSCKVRAIRTSDGTIYRRGVNLIDAPADTGPYGGHGTAVCGILNGGIPNEKRMTGIAPDAEVIVAQIPYNNAPRFYTDLATHMAWAQVEGATVFLYEDGEWVWEFLDGSTNEEIMMNELARDHNIVHVVPAGNLTGGGMMKTVTLRSRDTLQVSLNVSPGLSSVWPAFLWRGDGREISIIALAPSGTAQPIPFDDRRFRIDSTSIFSNITVSPRSTVRAAIEMSPVDSGRWSFRLRNNSQTDLTVYCLVGDNYFNWWGAAQWVQATEDNTVTWPATADSAIGIAAYDPRGVTMINSFSGRGRRLDGFAPVDIACPGSTVYSIGRNYRYTAFGGTSSAGPHGAGAAALLLQMFPSKRWNEIEKMIRVGALKDSLTGTVPNGTWGWGKLRILQATRSGFVSVPATADIPRTLVLDQNYPNPFSTSTIIPFRIDPDATVPQPAGAGAPPAENHSPRTVTIRIHDLFGRIVREIPVDAYSQREAVITADGLPDGLYLYSIQAGGDRRIRRMMILR